MWEKKIVIFKRVRLIAGSKCRGQRKSARTHTTTQRQRKRHTNTWLTRTNEDDPLLLALEVFRRAHTDVPHFFSAQVQAHEQYLSSVGADDANVRSLDVWHDSVSVVFTAFVSSQQSLEYFNNLSDVSFVHKRLRLDSVRVRGVVSHEHSRRLDALTIAAAITTDRVGRAPVVEYTVRLSWVPCGYKG